MFGSGDEANDVVAGGTMIDFRNLRTPQQFAAECPALTLKQVYGLIDRREELGLEYAIRKIGRRWTIDIVKFGEWWEGPTEAHPPSRVSVPRRGPRRGERTAELRQRWNA